MIEFICLAILFFTGCVCQDMPCYTGWTYSKVNGKCYMISSSLLNQSNALSICQSSIELLDQQNKKLIRLTKILNSNDLTALTTYLTSTSNNAPIWLDATPATSGSSPVWSDGTDVDISFFQRLSPGFLYTGNCTTFSFSFQNVLGQYQWQYSISGSDCSQMNVFVCEHDSKQCPKMDLQIDDNRLQLIPENLFVFSYVYISCKVGYFRQSELQPTTQSQTGVIPYNYAYCTGNQATNLDPFGYVAIWNKTTIEDCQQVSCSQFTGQVNNVVSQIPSSLTTSKPRFDFGDAFNVTCIKGYVSYSDPTKWQSAVTCQQSLSDKSQGQWAPISLTPCVPIKCNSTALFAMVPQNAAIRSARNKVSQQQYDPNFQKSFLSLFNNIITFQCSDGYFFPDRSWTKQIICDLNNNSLISGDWQGYLGTMLPLFPSCQSATCQYESIIITPSQNIQPNFLMMNSLGVFVNQTLSPGNPYPYQTQLLFTCVPGYTTAAGLTSQNLVCGPQGNWVPNLTPCLAVVPPLSLGKGPFYVPPTVEAQSAQQIGVVAIIILVLFLSLIIILDLSTLARDIKTMRVNIRHLKARLNKKKNVE